MTTILRGSVSTMARAISPADAWLASLLNAGPVNVRDIEAAAQAGGMSMRTVERAKKRLGVKADRSGKAWCWSLPQDRHEQSPQQQRSAGNNGTQPPPASDASSDPLPIQPPGPAVWQLAMVRDDHPSRNASLARAVPLWAVMGRK